MQQNPTILEGHSDLEKGAYLGAIASMATADRQASQEEIDSITQLCDAANLSATEKQQVINSATETSGEDLARQLDILKNSQLKYSLITDLIAFAKSDSNYSEGEKNNVEKIAEYLQVDQNQFSVLNQLAEKTSSVNPTYEEATHPNFLSSLGFDDKLKSAGINGGGLLKGLLSIVAPMILTGMVTRGLGNSSGGGLGGMFGGNSGGMFGGNSGGGMFGGNSGGGMFGGNSGGGMFGGNSGGMLGGGGLGSLIGMLSGGRGFGSTGGLLGNILRGL